ncbi:MAG: hypothetical protein O3A53_09995 [Acidobacteria bacterium]|nr:hypothetical protein [Acidobacteriota bacterium]
MPSFIPSNFTKLCFAFALGFVLLIPAQVTAQIFVGAGTGGSDDIFRLDDEANVVNLTKSQGDDYDPHQSPDGNCIVFTSDRDGFPRLYLMDANGDNQRPLTPLMSGVEEFEQEFSSDSARIAFVHKEAGKTSVWTTNKDGSDRKRLTPVGPFQYIRPRWQPGSRDILFNCREDDDDDLSVQPGRNQSIGHTRNVILWDDSMVFNLLLLQS